MSRERKTSFTQNWRLSRKQLMKKIQLLGYKPYSKGMCHGISCVAAHAMLLKNLKQFDDHLFKIKNITRKYNRGRLIEKIFCESVVLCQNPEEYPHLFSTRQIKLAQRPDTAMPLIMSSDLEAQGGMISVAQFSGIYSIAELETYCRCIRTTLEKMPHPVALLLSDERHIIAITYCTDEKTWFMVEPQLLPTRQFHSDLAMARAITYSLTPDLKKTVVSTMVFAKKSNETLATQAIEHYTHFPEWEKIHQICKEKQAYFARWLYIAATDNCLQDVKKLLEYSVDPNKPIIDSGNPLHSAVCQGHFHLVNLLLTHGAKPNIRHSKITSSPLYEAIRHDHTHVSDLLRTHGAHLRSGEGKQLNELGLASRKRPRPWA